MQNRGWDFIVGLNGVNYIVTTHLLRTAEYYRFYGRKRRQHPADASTLPVQGGLARGGAGAGMELVGRRSVEDDRRREVRSGVLAFPLGEARLGKKRICPGRAAALLLPDCTRGLRGFGWGRISSAE